ncbi:TetR/AcrR family transcriptional regulator [Pseudomonas sp. BJa5]|uniref:TetR/AcrR family transcriptional regulator n=1 Tax=Pseudomonas sp. BJa5 TaxID=2936270 RepID=UPI0025595AD1|nr:TetR/AcrR family transcriptional regulator [Pseudomonas sp. BGr12]MDL2419566.1 TetR/AcrR family transcriptional regulator [Pseudomonas sp. BGr12]
MLAVNPELDRMVAHPIQGRQAMAGRPREFDKQEALRKAMRLFWEHGYEGTSMSMLVSALGIASARIYAAFGSKQQLFEEAVALYESAEGGFADRALEMPDIRQALAQMLDAAIGTYTRAGEPRGCLVVSAASGVAPENTGVLTWLSGHRLQRTESIISRLHKARADGQLPTDADVEALGHFYATFLHGISVQARDGVSADALRSACKCALAVLPESDRR